MGREGEKRVRKGRGGEWREKGEERDGEGRNGGGAGGRVGPQAKASPQKKYFSGAGALPNVHYCRRRGTTCRTGTTSLVDYAVEVSVVDLDVIMALG